METKVYLLCDRPKDFLKVEDLCSESPQIITNKCLITKSFLI